MKTESRFDSVGWIFFGVVLVLSLYPTYLLLSSAFVESTPPRMVVGATAFLAGFGTAIFTWIVNSILGYISDRRSTSESESSPKGHKPKKTK